MSLHAVLIPPGKTPASCFGERRARSEHAPEKEEGREDSGRLQGSARSSPGGGGAVRKARQEFCRAVLVGALASLVGCVGTTGSGLVDFDAYAVGPEGIGSATALSFTTGKGWEVSLSRARLHIGAVYLNRAFPTSGAQSTSCILPGLYVAEVTGPIELDVLSGELQPFTKRGTATADRALAAEVWLTGRDVNADDDPTVILDIAGIATKAQASVPFAGSVTIGQNRAIPIVDPSLPGSNPICKQRIVSPIPADLTPAAGGALLLRVDPRGWFANVDFSALQPASHDPSTYAFGDDNSDQPNISLFTGLRATVGVYSFYWLTPAPHQQ